MPELLTVESKIRNLIYENFPLARKRQLDDRDSLLESGIVDSIGILEIVNFVEQNFAVRVSDDDLVPENFASVAAIAAFVQQRKESLLGPEGAIPVKNEVPERV